MNSIATHLSASAERLYDDDGETDVHRLVFSDARLKFVMNVMPRANSVFLAADPFKPEQACPMLEYGFTCTEIAIGPSAYAEEEIAIHFFEHRDSINGLRLTLTPRHDKNWYLWANVGGYLNADGSPGIR
ncbi:MAG: hypothetical protein AAFX06_31030 [Planctomycetota bacterium]